jgi:hypothetical protein
MSIRASSVFSAASLKTVHHGPRDAASAGAATFQPGRDESAPDAGTPDAGTPDAGTPDAGMPA